MTRSRNRTRVDGGWAYVSLVSAFPWVSPRPGVALAFQFVVFEATAIAMAWGYDLWRALPLATAAILVSTAGSGLMVAMSARIRALTTPSAYRRLLFESSIDVVMGLIAFIAFVTYLVVDAHGPTVGLLERVLGSPPPAPAVFLALLVAWDLSYRIGIGWWASVTSLWRSTLLDAMDPDEAVGFLRANLLTIGFAGLQLLLLPFLLEDRLLAMLVLGHVGAVVIVSTLAIVAGRIR